MQSLAASGRPVAAMAGSRGAGCGGRGEGGGCDSGATTAARELFHVMRLALRCKRWGDSDVGQRSAHHHRATTAPPPDRRPAGARRTPKLHRTESLALDTVMLPITCFYILSTLCYNSLCIVFVGEKSIRITRKIYLHNTLHRCTCFHYSAAQYIFLNISILYVFSL